MNRSSGGRRPEPGAVRLTGEEQRSVTHGEFWIPEAERVVYQRAIRVLNRAGIPFIVSGLYAMYEYTGIYRETKDLDLFLQPRHIIPAARLLRDDGFALHLEQTHWLAKAMYGDTQIDLIFGMGNGVALIDDAWYDGSRAGILAGEQVRVAPPEDLIWHRLFVSERHRFDMADVLHLMLCRGDQLDWQRLLDRLGTHWRLLLANVHFFDYVYPGHRARVPTWLRDELLRRLAAEEDDTAAPDMCNGTLISRFSFSIDVNEWGFRNARRDLIHAAREQPAVREIADSDVWQQRPDPAAEARAAAEPDAAEAAADVEREAGPAE